MVLEQFAKLPAADQISYEMGYLEPDSPDYLEPALNLINGRVSQAVSLSRPIGYPALLALVGASPTATLHVQALLLSLIPVCTFLLITVFTDNDLLGFAGGVVSSISPSGVAIGSLIMSDGFLRLTVRRSFHRHGVRYAT